MTIASCRCATRAKEIARARHLAAVFPRAEQDLRRRVAEPVFTCLKSLMSRTARRLSGPCQPRAASCGSLFDVQRRSEAPSTRRRWIHAAAAGAAVRPGAPGASRARGATPKRRKEATSQRATLQCGRRRSLVCCGSRPRGLEFLLQRPNRSFTVATIDPLCPHGECVRALPDPLVVDASRIDSKVLSVCAFAA